jgi:glycosyltransferase involved in cell wall biosynthesis
MAIPDRLVASVQQSAAGSPKLKVLVISPRFPWPPHTGDRARAALWLSALAPHARVALVAPDGRGIEVRGSRFDVELRMPLSSLELRTSNVEPQSPSDVPTFEFHPAARSIVRGARAAFTVLREGLPFQSLLAAPYAWDDAIAAARRSLGGFDATVVILTRADPWVRSSLNGSARILDAIDSLRRNAAERTSAASATSRWFWRTEERRQARTEREVSSAYDRIIVVNSDETREFGSKAVAISNSVRIAPLDPDVPRTFDFGFWGRLGYFANADAAKWLIDDIWPAIRRRHPSATLAIGGADVPRSIRRAAERAGIVLRSPVEEIGAFARSIRVAIFPIRYGSGQSNKVLEAAEAGCTIVATPVALRGLPQFESLVRVAQDTSSIANAAIELLDDHVMAANLRCVVENDFARERMLVRLAEAVWA